MMRLAPSVRTGLVAIFLALIPIALGGCGNEASNEPKTAEQPKPVDPDDQEGGTGSRGLGEPSKGQSSGSGAPATTPPPSPVPAATPPGSAQQEPWNIVPVYYGTDRARGPETTNIKYTGERARRLELGRALVTVPRNHKVPNIERPWTVRVPYFDIEIGQREDPNKHFTMQEIKALTQEQFLQLTRERIASASRYKKHALVFIHGFNTTFEFAIYRTAQISNDLKFDGAAFSFSWPSSGSVTPTGYNYDRESSNQSVKYLRAFLEMVVDQTGAEAVSVIAHSMGNQPALQVLKDIRTARPNGAVFNQIILAAPDVDRDAFENIATEIQGLAKTITLYAAENDAALRASRRFNGGVARAGDVPTSGPLVLSGVDTLDVTSVSTDGLGLNHSGYAENNRLLDDIAKLVSTGAPPSIRMPSLEVIPASAGHYWRFPKLPINPSPPITPTETPPR